MEVGDVKHVLQDSFGPFPVGKHVDLDAACAGSGDGAIVAQDHFGVLGERREVSEPGAM